MTSLMKKIFYTLLSISALGAIAISCHKELTEAPEDNSIIAFNSNIPTTIEAIINPDDSETKTQYDGNVTFGWTNGDQVRMPVVKWSGSNSTGSITACDFYTFKTTNDSGNASATFIINNGSADMEEYDPNPSGTANTWTSMGYLVYPHGIFNKEYSGTKPVVTLPASITYNASTPLDGGVVPLIGRKDGEKYKFSTAVGIIKLTISNAPSGGKKIKLVSTDKPIAGKFAISDVDATVSQIANTSATTGTYELTLTSLSLTDQETYEFYLPVPVGVYAANSLSISVLDSNDLPLLEKTIAKEVTIERNVVLSIPTLLYHRVYVDGNLSAPTLHTVKPSTASMVRVHIATEKLTSTYYASHYSEWKDGNRFSDSNASYNCASLTNKSSVAFLSSPGKYYLQYVVLKSGYTGIPETVVNNENVLIYGSVPFYFTPSENKIPVEASWLNVPYVSTAEGAVANLVDGAANTYWHSPYGSEDPARNATYGQIISVDLNEGILTTDGNLYFSFRTRSGAVNDHAKAMNIYVSNVRWDDAGFDAGKVLVGSTENALEGISPSSGVWIKNPIVCSGSGSYRYITVSILSNSTGKDLRTSGCTHMAEIEFYTK